MDNSELYKKEAVWMNFRHFGIILSNLAIFFAALTILIPLTNILGFMGIAVGFMLVFMLTILLTIFTVGMIWTTGFISKMWAWMQSASDNQIAFFNFIVKFWPYCAIAGAVLCFASSIILQFIKQDKKTGRIVMGYILGAVCIIACIFCFAGVFQA